MRFQGWLKPDEGLQFFCCYGLFRTHVEKGAFAIAFFGFALNLIEAIASSFSVHPTVHHYFDVPSSVTIFMLGAFINLSIIVAQFTHNHSLYLPYLIFMAIALFAGFLATVCVFTVGIVNANSSIIFGALACTVSLLLNGWFYSVIFRAHKFMRMQESAKTNEPPV